VEIKKRCLNGKTFLLTASLDLQACLYLMSKYSPGDGQQEILHKPRTAEVYLARKNVGEAARSACPVENRRNGYFHVGWAVHVACVGKNKYVQAFGQTPFARPRCRCQVNIKTDLPERMKRCRLNSCDSEEREVSNITKSRVPYNAGNSLTS
jgi:hypothetical protein